MTQGFAINEGTSETASPSTQSVLISGKDLTPEGKRIMTVCDLLGEEFRLLIACLVHKKSIHVSDMEDLLRQSQPAISHHLALLRVGGIFESDPDGKMRFYDFSRSGRNALQQTGEALLGIQPFASPDEQQVDAVPEAVLDVSTLVQNNEQGAQELSESGLAYTNAFRLIGDEMRLKILLSLSGKECAVGALCQTLEQSQPAISHHLALMREESEKSSAFLRSRRSGKYNFYSISRHGAGLIHGAARLMMKFSEPRQQDSH